MQTITRQQGYVCGVHHNIRQTVSTEYGARVAEYSVYPLCSFLAL
jgi:hypothetical protein